MHTFIIRKDDNVNKTAEIFGINVFNDATMRERLPKETYKTLNATIKKGKDLDLAVANVVANAMKDWALERGATHYTHWFQPMTDITAEKHDSFISPKDDGGIIMEFSGKELIKGEPDASSFPSGGLRATFEARGYTAWDPTSPAFIKDRTLCIPTAFCSFSGEVLDKKTPLLRSMEAISEQAVRIVRLFGKRCSRVITTVGPEQEYFLVRKDLYDKRRDLLFTGRTLFGAAPPKGQELEDHYFGALKPKVLEFMQDLDEELWKLGILAKTEHNEAAPAQHELAPIFLNTNISTDHNQLTMELMKKTALKHGMVCILHEKPFKGVNGSGKHNNWSLSTDKGENLLEPGPTPQFNLPFLTFLTAVVKAVDEHQDLLRVSAASAGNDHRLGAAEAPPAIVSIFLGDDLEGVLEAMANEVEYEAAADVKMKTGVHVLPDFQKDTTDRNRTSPFAFTGNKFEFRMLGSAASISCTNIILNTIVAEALCEFADELENSKDFEHDCKELIKRTYKEHKRIIFNGNNYSDEWVEEAKKRGLLNLKTTADAVPTYATDRNIELFEKFKVYKRSEVESRSEILLDNYVKTLRIEALTMLEMAMQDILPASSAYVKDLAETAKLKSQFMGDVSNSAEVLLIRELSQLNDSLYGAAQELKTRIDELASFKTLLQKAEYFRDSIIPTMEELRACADKLEPKMAKKYIPFPTYGELLFNN